MADRRPRIFLGIPCYGDVAREVLQDYMLFAYHCGRRMPDYDFFLGVRGKAEQFRARNQIVEAAQSVEADYLFMLDDDMILDPEDRPGPERPAYDVLRRLIAHDKDLIGALYYQKHSGCLPVLMRASSARGYRFLRDDEITGGLQRVDVAGGGCLLVKMRVFDRIDPPYFAPEHEFGTDVQLCRAATAAGLEVWADTSIVLGHLKAERTVVTARNRHRVQLEDQVPAAAVRSWAEAFDALVTDACIWTGYDGLDVMTDHAQAFHADYAGHVAAGGSQTEWYRRFPRQRVARQVWFNVTVPHKRSLTETILNSVRPEARLRILDFGCGIGLPAFVFAQQGHDVTALDVDSTGPLEFLAWRAKAHDVALHITGLDRDVLPLDGLFDVIVAMDVLEHLPWWRETLAALVTHLKPGGALFCNNAILDDQTHVEHIGLRPRDFQIAAAEENLVAVTAITYLKRADVAEPAA